MTGPLKFLREAAMWKQRNMRREHARLHPDGLTRSGKVCEICLLLAALREAHRRLPRCQGTTARGYRCSEGAGHHGPHSHPNDAAAALGVEGPAG